MAVVALKNGAPLSVVDYLCTFDEDNLSGVDCSYMSMLQVINAFHNEVDSERTRSRTKDDITNILYVVQRFQEKCANGMVLKPIHFTKQFLQMFATWLKGERSERTGKKLQESYIKKLIGSLQMSIAFAAQHKAKVAPNFKDFKFKVESKREHVAISDAEVWMIYAIDFKSHQKEWNIRDVGSWERARDMFVLQCNLGMRCSDIRKLKKEMYHDGCIFFRQQKTKGIAVIDLKRMTLDYDKTMEILERYDFNAPCLLSHSEYNKKIHKMCEFAGLTQEVTDHVVVDGETCTLTHAKYKDCSSHTSRRTFITYHDVKMGKSSEEIMRATGQKSISVMKNYSKHTEDFKPLK